MKVNISWFGLFSFFIIFCFSPKVLADDHIISRLQYVGDPQEKEIKVSGEMKSPAEVSFDVNAPAYADQSLLRIKPTSEFRLLCEYTSDFTKMKKKIWDEYFLENNSWRLKFWKRALEEISSAEAQAIIDKIKTVPESWSVFAEEIKKIPELKDLRKNWLTDQKRLTTIATSLGLYDQERCTLNQIPGKELEEVLEKKREQIGAISQKFTFKFSGLRFLDEESESLKFRFNGYQQELLWDNKEARHSYIVDKIEHIANRYVYFITANRIKQRMSNGITLKATLVEGKVVLGIDKSPSWNELGAKKINLTILGKKSALFKTNIVKEFHKELSAAEFPLTIHTDLILDSGRSVDWEYFVRPAKDSYFFLDEESERKVITSQGPRMRSE